MKLPGTVLGITITPEWTDWGGMGAVDRAWLDEGGEMEPSLSAGGLFWVKVWS